nr:hypothetical protein BaRGS_025111 [Batillaria attramentaria]
MDKMSVQKCWQRNWKPGLRNMEKSAQTLFDSVLHDDVYSVRRMALGVFVKHPRRRDVTRKQEDLILRESYNYEAVARVKRNVFERVLFQFKVALPRYEWNKEVGNSKIGVLQGYVDVDVHDKLFAEAHIGLINLQLDLLLVEACYRGRLSYNMNLVKNIADVAVVALPFAEKEIRSSVNTVLDVLGKVKDFPNQAFSVIDRAKMRKRRQASGNTFDNYTKCAEVEVGDALVTLYNKSEEMVTQLEIVLNNSPEELQRAMDLMQTQTEILKASFASFKEAFPNQRRDCDDQCGCGYYPTDCKRYGHPGVPSPVTGMVHVESGGSAVRIKPKTSDFKEYEVYVSNIELHQNYTNQTEFFIEAGQVFAFSKGNNNCNKGHIHIAMKRTSNETGLCHYVDPGPFLDTMQPIPTWHEECREFTFKHAFQVIDFDKLTEGFQSVLTELKRYALDSLKDMAIKKVVDLIPDDSLLAPFKDTALQFLNNLNTSADSLGNLFTSGWDAAKGFFGQIKQNFTFGGLLDMAADSNILKQKLPKLRDIADAARKAMKIPKSLAKLKNLTLGVELPENTQYSVEFKNPVDHQDQGSFPMAGFSGGAAIGMEFDVKVQAVDSYMKTTITPFVAAKLEAGVSVSIFVFGFGADLHGWIMRTRFPLSLETNYTKQPVVQTKRLEVNLVPVELKLKLWVEIKIEIKINFIWKIKIKLFSKRCELLFTCELQSVTEGVHAKRVEDEHFLTYERLGVGYSAVAINDIIHGGDLVTTVCHSLPFIVDITPPVVYGVNEVVFDDTFRFLAVYYNATDALSGLSGVEFGLGKTKYDVMVRKYMPFEMRGTGDNTYLLNEEFETASGVPSWIRIKVVDKVRLSATGFGNTPILLDSTPPIPGKVMDGAKIVNDLLTVGWRVEDPIGVNRTSLTLDRVEIALGSSFGTSDIQGFQEYMLYGGVYARGQLGLAAGTTVFATVRVTNGVGLYTVVRSAGVVISPNPRLEVWDGPGKRDLEGMADLNVIQGRWHFSDPCPIVRAEWAVTELSTGRYVKPFTPIPDSGQVFYDDTLSLENFKTYVSHVRVTDAQNRTYTAYSDGVTVDIQPPDTAAVWEGTGRDDQDYQVTLEELVASWDPFGDPQSVLPSQQILRYEVAVGTDRRWPMTRTNIHGFQDVGLALTHTFHGLNLTAKTVAYYITVRAYSAANTFSESSSDGIRAGYSGEIEPGSVTVDDFQSDVTSIRASWDGFMSDMGEMRYYVGVSMTSPPWDNSTYDCEELLNSTFHFDVQALQSVDSQLMATVDGLRLEHNATYIVTVVAEDLMLHCAAAISNPVLVDTTPPVAGEIAADGYDDGSAMFVHSEKTLIVNLSGFPDAESGIEKATVELIESQGCGVPSDGETLIREVDVDEEWNIAMRNLNLQLGKIYLLRATITNGARLTTTATSKPLLLDTSSPMPGMVKVGTSWTGPERLFQKETDTLQGTIAVVPFDFSSACVTQVDLMSSEYKDSWKEFTGIFSPDCTFIDSSVISLLIQHNPSMTGVDRGAVQIQNLTWREGDYTFRMAPAAGLNVLTGISLASPSLQPPFSSQNGIPVRNGSVWTCDSPGGDCETGSKNKSGERGLLPEGEYGAGLSFMEVNGTMKGLFWAQDRIGLKQTAVSFDTDPSATPADYVFRVKQLESESKEVSLLVNGKTRAAFSGLVFPDNMTLSIYTWNVEDFVPPVVDPFRPFRTVAEVTKVAIPVARKPLCSYGTPFHDSHSGVKEIWAGVSDSLNETANIVPFRKVKSFCTPCLLGCPNLCTAACNSTSKLSPEYNIFSLTLSNITLETGDDVMNSSRSSLSGALPNDTSDNTTSDELKAFRLPMYYLDVRVLAHSGLYADAKSSRVVVDTSRPVVNEIFCVDPLYSSDEPMEFIGSNNTVGLKWDVSEDVTGIAAQWVSIGSQPHLDDIVSWEKIDRLSRQHTLTDLDDSLVDETTYFFNLQVVNQAGLTTNASASFTVLTSPPDMSVVSPAPANVTSVMNISGVPVAFTDSTEKVVVVLKPSTSTSNSSVEYIEWMIGTKPGGQNVFPKTIVANLNVTEVAIVDGHLVIGGDATNITVGDYARSNFVSSNGSASAGSVFHMEPGRCLQQKILGVTKSHREGAVDLEPLCILRPSDTLALPGKSTVNLPVKDLSGSNTQKSQEVDVILSVGKGGMAVGVLSESDLDALYGTAASTDFSPYIIRPDPQSDPTSRFLRGRTLSTPGPHLYLAPVVAVELDGDIYLAYNVSASVVIPADATVKLVFWDADSQQWKSLEDMCSSSSQTFNSTSGHLVSKVCPEVFSDSTAISNRVKRSVPVQGVSPRMVTVTVVTASMVNAPPSVHNLSLVLHEDSDGYTTTITYTDNDNDVLEFTILHPPQNGNASVTPDGELTYKPNPNFFGDDLVVLQATEVFDAASLAAGVVPNVVNLSVVITVTGRNDPPELFYLKGTNDTNITPELLVGPAAGNGINVSVLVEGNTTTFVDLGLIVFGDVDASDTIIFMNQTRESPDASFSVRDVSPQDDRLASFSITGAPSGVGAKEISLSFTEGYHGTVVYEARVRDAANTYSLQLTLGVHVMISPCVHGHCQSRTPGETCADWQRAHTFDLFLCHCDPGYEGQWCHVETNECRTATCSPVTDCVDLVNGYRCDPNLEKTLAIAFCSLVAVLLAAAGIYKLKKMKKKSKTDPGDSQSLDSFGKPKKYG